MALLETEVAEVLYGGTTSVSSFSGVTQWQPVGQCFRLYPREPYVQYPVGLYVVEQDISRSRALCFRWLVTRFVVWCPQNGRRSSK